MKTLPFPVILEGFSDYLTEEDFIEMEIDRLMLEKKYKELGEKGYLEWMNKENILGLD